MTSSGSWATLDTYHSMADATADVKALTVGVKSRTRCRLLDTQTREPVSYFDAIAGSIHPSKI
jgi:hypothetical protein